MAKYLAKFSSMVNEIEVSGFIVMNDREVENFEELALSITHNQTELAADQHVL